MTDQERAEIAKLANKLWELRERLPMFVMYDHPADFPDLYVAKLWVTLPAVEATDVMLGSATAGGAARADGMAGLGQAHALAGRRRQHSGDVVVTGPTAEFVRYLHVDCGYRIIRDMGDGRYVCLMPLLFTVAIVTGDWGNRLTLNDRWCYHNNVSALEALDAWEKAGYAGEPAGWHRHPASGRRRREDGEEYIDP